MDVIFVKRERGIVEFTVKMPIDFTDADKAGWIIMQP